MYYKGERLATTSPNSDLHGYGEAIREELAGRIPQDRAVRALDVGTGFGINVAFLARMLGRGSEVWSIDPSREVLEASRAALGRAEARRVRFVEASADDTGFEDGFFDVVSSVMVLHHIASLQPALEEMARVLAPGGLLVLVDYKPAASKKLEFRSRHEAEDFFTAAEVARGLAKAGLEARRKDFGVWYLVEARKLNAPRGGGRARPAGRARAGR